MLSIYDGIMYEILKRNSIAQTDKLVEKSFSCIIAANNGGVFDNGTIMPEFLLG